MQDASALVRGAAPIEVLAEAAERDLVGLAAAGAAEARDELARRCRGPAYILALQLMGNREDALDVAQEALLRLFVHLDRITPGRPVKPWLLTIVRNLVRDEWRRQRTRRAESIEGSPDGLLGELVDSSPNPEADAQRLELKRRVWRAMAELSSDHREIVLLRDFHGLSYGEIACALEIKAGTVMSRLHAARQKLRARLVEEGPHA
jgi:RNA polymerase sigma-70 factor (ECF subfamily)